MVWVWASRLFVVPVWGMLFFLLRYRWLWPALRKEKRQVLIGFTQIDFLFTTLSRFYWLVFILAGMLVNPASVAVITGL